MSCDTIRAVAIHIIGLYSAVTIGEISCTLKWYDASYRPLRRQSDSKWIKPVYFAVVYDSSEIMRTNNLHAVHILGKSHTDFSSGIKATTIIENISNHETPILPLKYP